MNPTLKNMQFSGIILCFVCLSGCSADFSKYEALWAIDLLYIDQESRIEDVIMYNLRIDTDWGYFDPPSLYGRDRNRQEPKKQPHMLRIFKQGEQDYMEIIGDSQFAGVYELNCLDEECCSLTMKSEHVYMELSYAGELLFGFERDCPTPKPYFELDKM